MIRLVVLLFAFVFAVSIVFFLLLSLLVLLALACAVGIPLYLMSRHWTKHQGIRAPFQSPMDRLRALYVEDKIDLGEFERRVARLIKSDRHGY